jgi:hypothetical protein
MKTKRQNPTKEVKISEDSPPPKADTIALGLLGKLEAAVAIMPKMANRISEILSSAFRR